MRIPAIMKRERVAICAVALLAAVATASACSDHDDKGSSGGTVTPPTKVSPDVDAGRVRAEFGLDQRPSNPTCLAPPRPTSSGGPRLEQVYAPVELNGAIQMAQPPGDGSRWFVAQREGLVVSFPTTNPPATPAVVADVGALAGTPIRTDVEGGLLGLAFHPRFADNGRLFVTFTTEGPGGYASEVGFLTSTDRGTSFSSYTRVLRFDRPKLFHCGGGIAFGNEGLLYLSFGDGAMDGNGQNPNGFFAKVLRIDVDNVPAGQTYGIPKDNPFRAGGGEPATFARGVRNPFRLSIDHATNDIWVGDVGEASYEEVNRITLGKNYGWPCREGAHDLFASDPNKCPSTAGLVDPVFEHAHMPVGSLRSLTGGVVYRGAAMPELNGTYIYGDFVKEEIWALTVDPATGTAKSAAIDLNGLSLPVTNFAEDVSGEIYATSVLRGAIYKLVPSAAASTVSTFPDRLSKTGCVDPANPTKPAAGLVPYDVNAPLWSDGADKERLLALPDGKTIGVGADGDLDLPVGSVAVKTFSFGGKRVETRPLVRHEDGDWGGYSYEWNDAQTDAVLLAGSLTKSVGDRTWTFPSRSDCGRCHTAAAGRTLGLELAQLNGDFVYESTQRLANQLTTLEHIGMFTTPLGKPASELASYPSPTGNAPLDARARAHLHANCSMCHRPEGGSARAAMDFRFTTSFADTRSCGVQSVLDDLGVADAKIIAPGKPESSLVSLRTHATNGKRMPPLGTRLVDPEGTAVLDDWIRGLTGCP